MANGSFYKFNHSYSSDGIGAFGEGDVIALDDAPAELIERDSPGSISKSSAKAESVADRALHQERPDDNQTARGRERQEAARYRDRMMRGTVATPITVEGEVYGDTDGDGDPARNAVMPPEAPQVEPAPEAVPPVGEPSATGEAKPKGKGK
jgi:hypothetical protein